MRCLRPSSATLISDSLLQPNGPVGTYGGGGLSFVSVPVHFDLCLSSQFLGLQFRNVHRQKHTVFMRLLGGRKHLRSRAGRWDIRGELAVGQLCVPIATEESRNSHWLATADSQRNNI